MLTICPVLCKRGDSSPSKEHTCWFPLPPSFVWRLPEYQGSLSSRYMVAMPATFNAEYLSKCMLWMQGNFHVQLSFFIRRIRHQVKMFQQAVPSASYLCFLFHRDCISWSRTSISVAISILWMGQRSALLPPIDVPHCSWRKCRVSYLRSKVPSFQAQRLDSDASYRRGNIVVESLNNVDWMHAKRAIDCDPRIESASCILNIQDVKARLLDTSSSVNDWEILSSL